MTTCYATDRAGTGYDVLASTVNRPPTQPVDRAGLVERLRLTAILAGYAVAGAGALALFILTTVAVALTPIGVGLVLLAGLVPAVAGLTAAHRRVAGRLLGRPVEHHYTDGVRRWRDPARWRDYRFLAFAATAGLVLSMLPVLLVGSVVTWLAVAIADASPSWVWLLMIPPAVALWWLLTPVLLDARLRAEHHLLTHR